jgi:hypothetical protein
LKNFKADASYSFQWFDTINGEWKEKVTVMTDDKGRLAVPDFPDGRNPSVADWAAKIILNQ